MMPVTCSLVQKEPKLVPRDYNSELAGWFPIHSQLGGCPSDQFLSTLPSVFLVTVDNSVLFEISFGQTSFFVLLVLLTVLETTLEHSVGAGHTICKFTTATIADDRASTAMSSRFKILLQFDPGGT